MNKQATIKILSAVQWWKTPLSAICLLCLFIIMSASCDANHINDNEEKHKTLAEMFYNAERQIILHHEDSARTTIALIEQILADKLTDKEAETGVKIYNNLGYLCQFRLNNYSQALVYYNKGLVLSDKYDINTILPSLYHNIANIYHSFGDNEHAHHYFRLALEKARIHGKPKSVLLTLCTMTINKIEAGDFNDTDIDFPSHIIADTTSVDPGIREYSRLFLSGYKDMCGNRNDIAVQRFDSSMLQTENHIERDQMLSNALLAKGIALMRMGDYERASNVLSYATTTLDTIQIQNELMGLYRSLAISYTSLGNKTAADSIWLRFYKLKHDKFGSKGANALFIFYYTYTRKGTPPTAIAENRHQKPKYTYSCYSSRMCPTDYNIAAGMAIP